MYPGLAPPQTRRQGSQHLLITIPQKGCHSILRRFTSLAHFIFDLSRHRQAICRQPANMQVTMTTRREAERFLPDPFPTPTFPSQLTLPIASTILLSTARSISRSDDEVTSSFSTSSESRPHSLPLLRNFSHFRLCDRSHALSTSSAERS